MRSLCFFQAEDGIRDGHVTGVQTCALPISPVGQVTIGDGELDIYLEQGDSVETLEELQDLQIAGFPLTDVATVDEALERPSIATHGGQATVTAAVTPASTDDVGATTDDVPAAIDAPERPEGAQADTGGAAEHLETIFGQLLLAIVAAVLLTYVLLVWIFKSLIQPLILLVSIPSAATGSFGLLVISQVPLGLPSMIGLLMLVGVVVTNAIVLIDLVNQYRRQGMGLDEGLLAGAQKRLRPILMTSAATIFALVPMALGVTGNSGFIAQPLAVVVIGGLISSTLLTLVIVPVLYRIAEGPGERRRIREEELAQQRRRAREEAAAERARRQQAQRSVAQGEATPRGGSAHASVDPVGPVGSVGSVGPAGSAGRRTRRGSLKERGGIVGMIRRSEEH